MDTQVGPSDEIFAPHKPPRIRYQRFNATPMLLPENWLGFKIATICTLTVISKNTIPNADQSAEHSSFENEMTPVFVA